MRILAVVMFFMIAGAASAQDDAGAEAIRAFNWCMSDAEKQCPRDTIRCRSFRKGFVKACMMQIGVEPDRIRLLIEDL